MQAERGTVAALVPMYLRGAAFLAKRDAASARREFQSILDARGADPFAPVIPLAQLGLGRAWALAGEAAKSRQAYDEFFRLWARADPDLRVLREARAEYGRLATTPAPAPQR
jgi:hypothetical protein